MKTKIIATIGPACSEPTVISQLISAGVRIFRLNFSHGDAASFAEIIHAIRQQEIQHEVPVTIMQDLSGPKIRIGNLEETLSFIAGGKAHLGPTPLADSSLPYIPFDKKEILDSLEPKDRLVLADGTLEFRVEQAHADGFIIIAQNSGIVTSRKGLALPGKHTKLPALTDKDKVDLVEGLRLGVDAVALSYVQTPDDILEAKALIKAQGRRQIPVCAKLERQNAVDRLEEILAVTDIVMVARGDLGIECPLPALPALQKRIIAACNQANVPVIVATQMLLSMVNNPSPTRAETTDVANAVLDGADCVMLSEETAMGSYPVETVRFMGQIAYEAEALLHDRRRPFSRSTDFINNEDFLAHSACHIAERVKAAGIVVHSMSGASGRKISSHRPAQAVYVLTPDHTVLCYLNFSWGVTPCSVDGNMPGHLERAEFFIDSNPKFASDADYVITAGQPRYGEPPRGTNLVKIYRK